MDDRSFKPNTLSFEEAYKAHSYAGLVEATLRAADRAAAHPDVGRRLGRRLGSLALWLPLTAIGGALFYLLH